MGILETVDPPSSSQAGSPPSSTTGDDAPHGGVTSLLGPEFGHDWTDSGVVEEPSETIALVSEILWAEEESAQSGALEQRHSGIFGVAQPAGRLDTNDGAQSGHRSKGRGDSDEPLLPHPEELAHGALLPDFGAEPFFGSVGASRPTVHSGHTRVLEYEEAALRGDGDLAVAEQYASQGRLGKNPDVSPRARPRTPRSLARGMAEGLREELHQALEQELLPVGVPVPADPPSELPFQVDRVQAGGISEQHEDTSQLEKGATEFERPQLLISGHGYSVSPWWWTALGAAVIFGIAYALFG